MEAKENESNSEWPARISLHRLLNFHNEAHSASFCRAKYTFAQ